MLELRELRLRRGAAVLFDRANLTIFRGDKIGIVGRNGCGKSSLLALLRGDLGADAGDYSVPGKLNFVSVSQELPRTEATVLEYVRSGDARLMAIEAELEKARAADDGMQEAHLLGDYELAGGYTSAARAAELADGLGFEPGDIERPVKRAVGWIADARQHGARADVARRRADARRADQPPGPRRGAVAGALAAAFSRHAAAGVARSRVPRRHRQPHREPRERPAHALDRQLHRFPAPARRQHPAVGGHGRAPGSARVARLHSFIDRFRAQASKARQVQSRIKALSKLETITTYQELDTFEWEFAAANKLPQPLVTLDRAAAGYGERVVISGVGRSVNPGERIGILGRNGAGKSTLMKLISGALPPSGGDRVASPDLIVGNFAQLEVDRLDSRDTALIALTNRIDEIGVRSQWDEQRRRNHLGGFGFRGDRVFEPVVHFSGGERARLALAILVAERPNLLLLDEPTNHLDFEMRHSLITALQDFAGAVIVVSHDRGLLRSVCDQFWLVADGAVTRLRRRPRGLLQLARKARQRGLDAGGAEAARRGDSREQKRKDADDAQGPRAQTPGDQVHRDIARQARPGARQAREGTRRARLRPRSRACAQGDRTPRSSHS